MVMPIYFYTLHFCKLDHEMRLYYICHINTENERHPSVDELGSERGREKEVYGEEGGEGERKKKWERGRESPVVIQQYIPVVWCTNEHHSLPYMKTMLFV